MDTKELVTTFIKAQEEICKPDYVGAFMQLRPTEIVDGSTTQREIALPLEISKCAIALAEVSSEAAAPELAFVLVMLPPRKALAWINSFFVSAFEIGRAFEKAKAQSEVATAINQIEQTQKAYDKGYAAGARDAISRLSNRDHDMGS